MIAPSHVPSYKPLCQAGQNSPNNIIFFFFFFFVIERVSCHDWLDPPTHRPTDLVPQARILNPAHSPVVGDGVQQTHHVEQLAVHQGDVAENGALEEYSGKIRR